MFIRDDRTPGTYEENVNFYMGSIKYTSEHLNFLVSEFDKYLKTRTRNPDGSLTDPQEMEENPND